GGRRWRSLSALALDVGDGGADRHLGAGLVDDLDERTARERLHLLRRLLALDLGDDLAARDGVAHALQPGGDGTALHVVAEVRHLHLDAPRHAPFTSIPPSRRRP